MTDQRGNEILEAWTIKRYDRDGYLINDGADCSLALVQEPCGLWIVLLTNGDDYIPGADMPDEWADLARVCGDGDIASGKALLLEFIERIFSNTS